MSKPFAAFSTALLPLIRLMLRSGITYREFTELCKPLFVEVARQDYGINGRPTNISRIALLTGIDRKEVKRLLETRKTEKAPAPDTRKTDRITRMLSVWHQDPHFCDGGGKPRTLYLEGEPPNFLSLCQAQGGNTPPVALFKEMVRLGVVEEVQTDDGRRGGKPLARAYLPPREEAEALLRAGQVVSELGDTLHYNIYSAAHTERRFERRATNTRIPPQQREAFQAFLNKEGQRFLENVDQWLSQHEVDTDAGPDASTSNSGVCRMGAALFAIETPLPEPDQEYEL